MQSKTRNIGYATVEGVLSHQECDSIARTVGSNSTSGRAGVRNLMSDKTVARLAFDSRLIQLAGDAFGTEVLPFRATLFEKSADANWHVHWHQDRALPLSRRHDSHDWGPWTWKAGVLHALAPAWALKRVVALRVHLDASAPDNGPLRVIPKSHEAGILSSTIIRSMTSARAADTCVVGRGGVVTMSPLLLHSSVKARCDEPRRVIHIEYADSLDLGMGFRLCVA